MAKKRMITMSSTAWQSLTLEVISNFQDETKIYDRKWNRREKCYTKKIDVIITEKCKDDLRLLLNHLASACDEDSCKFCKAFKKEYY